MILVPAILLAQAGFTFSDAESDIALRAREGQGEMTAKGYKFDLKGGVSVSSKSRRVRMDADAVIVFLAKGEKAGSPDELDTATATGRVRIQQAMDQRLVTLESNSATYLAKSNGAEVQAKGSVKIFNRDSAKRETMTATGSSGMAFLNPKSKRGIDQATLQGPVKLILVQAGPDGSKVTVTGGKLALSGDTITLMGNVNAVGQGPSRFGNLSQVDSLVIQLNEKGEMTRFRFKSRGAN